MHKRDPVLNDDGQPIDSLLTDFSDEELEEAKQQGFLAIAKSGDNPVAFEGFWNYMTMSPMPRHGRSWVLGIYEAKSKDMGSLIFAFRGGWKTTMISILFTAFRMGLEPHKSNLVIGNNDDSASLITAAIARMIDLDPRYREVFPNVRPDKKAGWGAKGYFIRDTTMPKKDWAKLVVARKDPSLLGLGITSGSVIGKHPSGVLIMDDIHDQQNTESELERSNVIVTVTDTILPLAIEDRTAEPGAQAVTWVIAVGTPWKEDDAYHYLRDTGEFYFVNTPLIEPVPEDTEGAVEINHKQLKGHFLLKWPDHFPVDAVKKTYNKVGHRGFGRMFMLSLAASNEFGLQFMTYDHEKLPKWSEGIWFGGVDYASIIELRGKVINSGNRSKFAIAYGVILNNRTAVIAGGTVGNFTQLQSEGITEATVNQFYNFRQLGVEMNGKGEEYYQLMMRKPDIAPFMFPHWVGTLKKPTRLETSLGPWLEMGKILISDEDTPFLNLVRKALWEFPHGNLDVLDAIYSAAKVLPDILTVDAAPDGAVVRPQAGAQRTVNPLTAFGNRKYFSTQR